MDYSKVNLHFLRIYAREIGVRSPSTCTKQELIEKIKDIESGKVKPYFNKLGRPISKKLSYKIEQPKPENNEREKQIHLFIIDKFKDFLDGLEKEIENKF